MAASVALQLKAVQKIQKLQQDILEAFPEGFISLEIGLYRADSPKVHLRFENFDKLPGKAVMKLYDSDIDGFVGELRKTIGGVTFMALVRKED